MKQAPFKLKSGNSPMAKKTLGEFFRGSKLGKDLKKLGTKLQDAAANIKHSTPESRKKKFTKGLETASSKRSEASKKRSKQLQRFFIPKKK